jgi:hypothetical protein
MHGHADEWSCPTRIPPARTALPGCSDSLPRRRDDLGVVRREDFVNNRLEGRAQVVKDPLLCRVLQVERLVALLVPMREEVRKHECFIAGSGTSTSSWDGLDARREFTSGACHPLHPRSANRPLVPRSATTARTGCHGGLSEFVPVDEVDAATVLSHTSGRSRRIRYWRPGVAPAAANACGRARNAEYK